MREMWTSLRQVERYFIERTPRDPGGEHPPWDHWQNLLCLVADRYLSPRTKRALQYAHSVCGGYWRPGSLEQKGITRRPRLTRKALEELGLLENGALTDDGRVVAEYLVGKAEV